jgi:hypothetical protein
MELPGSQFGGSDITVNRGLLPLAQEAYYPLCVEFMS